MKREVHLVESLNVRMVPVVGEQDYIQYWHHIKDPVFVDLDDGGQPEVVAYDAEVIPIHSYYEAHGKKGGIAPYNEESVIEIKEVYVAYSPEVEELLLKPMNMVMEANKSLEECNSQLREEHTRLRVECELLTKWVERHTAENRSFKNLLRNASIIERVKYLFTKRLERDRTWINTSKL